MLNALDRRSQLNAASPPPTAEQIQIADECARRTLDICLSKKQLLNNLERARLLDILLWCGDVVNPRKLICSRPPEVIGRYEKPPSRRETSRSSSSRGASSSSTPGL
jgi:hypothetical protein